MTFRCRFSSSSRYGTMTCVPALAERTSMSSPGLYARGVPPTEFRDEVPSEEARAAKDSDNMASVGTSPRRTVRNEGFVRER